MRADTKWTLSGYVTLRMVVEGDVVPSVKRMREQEGPAVACSRSPNAPLIPDSISPTPEDSSVIYTLNMKNNH